MIVVGMYLGWIIMVIAAVGGAFAPVVVSSKKNPRSRG